MLNVSIRLREFMDSGGIASWPISVSALVTPRFEEAVPPVDPNDPLQPLLADNDGPGGGNNLTRLVPRFGRAEVINQNGQTNQAGVANFSFDVAAAFTRVANANPTAADVKAYLEIDTSGAPITRKLRLVEMPMDADDDFDTALLVDFGKSIVGHTSENSARLWFQYHGNLRPTQQFTCEVEAAAIPLRRVPVSLGDQLGANTGVVEVNNLAPGQDYRYRLIMNDPADTTTSNGRTIASGSFSTPNGNNRQISLAFGSCHQPVASNSFGFPEALNRWRALSRREDYDLLILMGDQVYGDSIGRFWPQATWRERYHRLYQLLWQYQPMRQVLRRTPTYMMLDDHDVDDDFGTAPIDNEGQPGRLEAAMLAYRVYQDSHNPSHNGTAQHYHFRRGFAAFFVMDLRTQRGKDPDFPILGREQWDDLVGWANAAETRACDVIFIVASVGPALLPADQLADMAEGAAVKIGAVAGAAVGGAFGGIGGAVIGGLVGAGAASIGYDYVESWAETKADIADQWVFEDNQKDLTRVLDLLFDLGNDIRNGTQGDRPRAVIVLSGDAHLGAMHLIRSNRTGGGHNHRRNPLIYQLLSSSISRPPLDTEILVKVLKVIDPNAILSETEFAQGPFDANKINEAVENLDLRRFILDHDGDEHYAAEFVDLMIERTYGHMEVERLGNGRRYRFHTAILGERSSSVQIFDLDLDAQTIKPDSLIGDVLATTGRVSLLRVNEIGSQFGPPGDQVDAEVIVQLDSEPGRSFGFKLRRGPDLPVQRRMLDLLRGAFNHDRRVRLDYTRTGARNGLILRVNELL